MVRSHRTPGEMTTGTIRRAIRFRSRRAARTGRWKTAAATTSSSPDNKVMHVPAANVTRNPLTWHDVARGAPRARHTRDYRFHDPADDARADGEPAAAEGGRLAASGLESHAGAGHEDGPHPSVSLPVRFRAVH